MQAHTGQPTNYVDVEYNRVVRIWLCGGGGGGDKKDTMYELLAAAHCLQPSNGCNLATTNHSVQSDLVISLDIQYLPCVAL